MFPICYCITICQIILEALKLITTILTFSSHNLIISSPARITPWNTARLDILNEKFWRIDLRRPNLKSLAGTKARPGPESNRR